MKKLKIARAKKPYCTQNEGDCSTCSLVNYGYDCHNRKIEPDPVVMLTGDDSEALAKAEMIERKIILIKKPNPCDEATERREADCLTAALSVFKSFQELLDAPEYRPSLNVSESRDAFRLACLYDMAQERRGDPRRASRY